jgi:hypothetical protein
MFEIYCQKRWNMTRQYANRLIDSSIVISNLETMVSKVETESQARALPFSRAREAECSFPAITAP